MRRVVGAIVVLSLAVAGAGAAPAWAGSGSSPEIRVLSNRADLVSGDDALVQVVPPAGTDARALKVTVDRRDVTPAFAVRSDGRYLGQARRTCAAATTWSSPPPAARPRG